MSIADLKESDVGRRVKYTGRLGGQIESGRIKSWNDKCGGNWHDYQRYTGNATDPADLTFEDIPRA